MESPAPGFALESEVRSLELPERFEIRVLGSTQDRVDATAIKLVNRRLMARVAKTIAAGEAIRIDSRDAIVLGEVLACWREGNAIVAAIDLQHALTRLSELAVLFGAPGPVEVRRSA